MVRHGFTLLVFGYLVATSRAAADEPLDRLLGEHAKAVARKDYAAAVGWLDQLLDQQPKHPTAWYLRGRDHFRWGRFKESVRDFDRHVQLAPDQAARQWERGIAQYYAGDFEEGARQFELYQTYHDSDVENSVWRFLCLAQSKGVEAARKTLLPIKNDRRLGMMQIFELYRGGRSPEDVLRYLGSQNEADPEQLGAAWFYADLYLGLYYEVIDQPLLARYHLDLAASPAQGENRRVNTYMWDVARLHAQRFRASRPKQDAKRELTFNGRDLTGWVVQGKPTGWKVQDGVLRSEGGQGGDWLRSGRTFSDFVLDLQWRVSAGGNSGVFLRSADQGAPWTTGYEVQISNAPRDTTHCTGALYGYAPVRPRPDERPDVWHRFVIYVRGPLIRVTCDGVTCLVFDQATDEATRDKPLQGYVGLQDAHAPAGNYIEFRQLRVLDLTADGASSGS